MEQVTSSLWENLHSSSEGREMRIFAQYKNPYLHFGYDPEPWEEERKQGRLRSIFPKNMFFYRSHGHCKCCKLLTGENIPVQKIPSKYKPHNDCLLCCVYALGSQGQLQLCNTSNHPYTVESKLWRDPFFSGIAVYSVRTLVNLDQYSLSALTSNSSSGSQSKVFLSTFLPVYQRYKKLNHGHGRCKTCDLPLNCSLFPVKKKCF